MRTDLALRPLTAAQLHRAIDNERHRLRAAVGVARTMTALGALALTIAVVADVSTEWALCALWNAIAFEHIVLAHRSRRRLRALEERDITS